LIDIVSITQCLVIAYITMWTHHTSHIPPKRDGSNTHVHPPTSDWHRINSLKKQKHPSGSSHTNPLPSGSQHHATPLHILEWFRSPIPSPLKLLISLHHTGHSRRIARPCHPFSISRGSWGWHRLLEKGPRLHTILLLLYRQYELKLWWSWAVPSVQSVVFVQAWSFSRQTYSWGLEFEAILESTSPTIVRLDHSKDGTIVHWYHPQSLGRSCLISIGSC
jgi:hypothetical protein